MTKKISNVFSENYWRMAGALLALRWPSGGALAACDYWLDWAFFVFWRIRCARGAYGGRMGDGGKCVLLRKGLPSLREGMALPSTL